MKKIIRIENTINNQQYILYGADAEMVSHILNNGLLNNLLNDFSSEKIEEELFLSLGNASERKTYFAAQNISVKIIKKTLGLDISKLYDKLKDYENQGEFYKDYREHVIHQWRVFLLGIYLWDTVLTIKDKINKTYKEQFIRVWSITALCHDIGYLFEKDDITSPKYANETIGLLNELETDGLLIFCPELDWSNTLQAQRESIVNNAGINKLQLQDWKQLFYIAVSDKWRLNVLKNFDKDKELDGKNDFEKYYSLARELAPSGSSRSCFIDHGLASAAIILYLFERKREWVEKLCCSDHSLTINIVDNDSVNEACRAIALHNIRTDLWDHNQAYLQQKIELNRFKINFENDILAFLLVLCDSLQEWNRPSRNIYNRDSEELTSQSIHIMPQKDKVYLCFPQDVLANSMSPESSFHRITKTINTLLEFGGCFSIVECRDTDLGKYIKDGLMEKKSVSINPDNELDSAYELYKLGRTYGNSKRWAAGKQYHIDAANLFSKLNMTDWASRSLGRAAFDAHDLGCLDEADDLLEEAFNLDEWQGTANYYWILEHCVRNDQSFEVMENYFDKLLNGMLTLEMINDSFMSDFRGTNENEKFILLWNKLILFFEYILQREQNWPSWSKSDVARRYVLMAELNADNSRDYLSLAEEEYKNVALVSYASWTRAKYLSLSVKSCNNLEALSSLLSEIIDIEKSILQTPGGPRDIVRFAIKVNSFFYNILLYVLKKESNYLAEAKVYLSAIDAFVVSQKFEFKTQCQEIIELVEKDFNDEVCQKLVDKIKNSVSELAWIEKNKMMVLLRQ